MRVRRTLAAVLAGGIALTACGGGGGSTADTAKPEMLTLAIGGESEDGYDPTLGWGRYGSPLFQSTLLRLDADLGVEGDLATDWEVSEDGLTWTVAMRDDAVFSDGEPVTAEDVAYTFMTAKESPGLTDVSSLTSAEAVDDTTVRFTLEQPQSTFVYRLTSLGIVPEHAHGADYARNPVGSGPFTFVQWDQGQQLIVERNEDYYGERPQFDRVTFVFGDEDGALASARAGQVDMAAVGSSLATAEIPGFDLTAVPSIDNRGIVFPYVPDEGRTTDAGAPIGNDVTSDLAVRRAVNLAADRTQLVEGVLGGYGSPATGPVDGAPYANPEAGIEDADPEGAARVLEEAGWRDADGDGVREKDGVEASFRILYPADDTVRQGLAVALADQVEAAGIRVEPAGASWEEIEQRMHAEPVMFGWGSHDPTEMYNLYSARQQGVEYYNPGFYADEAVQSHLDEALTATDPEAADAAWRAAQLDEDGNGFSAAGDAAWAWLVNLDHTYFVDSCLDLGDLQTEPHGHGWPITAGITGWSWSC